MPEPNPGSQTDTSPVEEKMTDQNTGPDIKGASHVVPITTLQDQQSTSGMDSTAQQEEKAGPNIDTTASETNPDVKDKYTALIVSKDATPDQIRAAYKEWERKIHGAK